MLWGTVLKALYKSRYVTFVVRPLSTDVITT